MTMPRSAPAAALLLLVAGCTHRAVPSAAGPSPAGPTVSATAQEPGTTLYRCGTGVVVTVRAEGDFVRLSGLPRGEERLGRDAGGLTPQQAVFSGPTLRAQFGLGADGQEMVLQSLAPLEVLHCRLD